MLLGSSNMTQIIQSYQVKVWLWLFLSFYLYLWDRKYKSNIKILNKVLIDFDQSYFELYTYKIYKNKISYLSRLIKVKTWMQLTATFLVHHTCRSPSHPDQQSLRMLLDCKVIFAVESKLIRGLDLRYAIDLKPGWSSAEQLVLY